MWSKSQRIRAKALALALLLTACAPATDRDRYQAGESDAVADSIRAREPGTWRLRYPVGVGCSGTAPLGVDSCAAVGEIVSNVFEVVELACVVSGCSGQLCGNEPMASTCEWLPHHACFRAAKCGRYGAAGACAWQPTAELDACLEELRGIAPLETVR